MYDAPLDIPAPGDPGAQTGQQLRHDDLDPFLLGKLDDFQPGTTKIVQNITQLLRVPPT